MTQYTVERWNSAHATKQATIYPDGADTSANFTGLTECTKYDIDVIASSPGCISPMKQLDDEATRELNEFEHFCFQELKIMEIFNADNLMRKKSKT